MGTFGSIVLVLLMCSVFVIPFIRPAQKPPPPAPPKPPDLRPLEVKVEEYVRIMRAATQIERQRRKTARIQALRDWKRKFKELRDG